MLLSSDLVKHIENIHIDDRRQNVLTKIIKSKSGIKYQESDHNIIVTQLNLPWNEKRHKIIKIFLYNDKEAQKHFKLETTNTTELSKIIDMDKPINVVTKKLLQG